MRPFLAAANGTGVGRKDLQRFGRIVPKALGVLDPWDIVQEFCQTFEQRPKVGDAVLSKIIRRVCRLDVLSWFLQKWQP